MDSRLRSNRRFLFVLAGLLAGAGIAAPSLAQQPGGWEVNLFGGGSFGSRIYLTPTVDSKLGIAPAWGLRASFGITRAFALEASFSHARPDLKSKDPVTEVALGAPIPVDVYSYEVNGLFGWGRGPWKGYFGIGAGFRTLDPSTPSEALPHGNTRFSANVALGGKYFFTDSFGLRVDGRYRWRAVPSHVGTVVCGEEGCHTFTTNLFSSAEVNLGAVYRFGGGGIGSSEPSSGEKRFWTAAGEVVLMELLPWSFNRYISDAEFAHISMDTVSKNFETGFTYDRDHFETNQSAHPYHGSLFFNSARSNGYGYWESGAFTFAGSFLWETLMEKEPPAINDLVNTTMGGMVRGEIQHRLSKIILDNTASGSDRFFRELGAALVNPMGAFNRLIHGEMTADAPNPDDRWPSSLQAGLAVGYRHVGGDAAHPDQGLVTLGINYGDPFAGEVRSPFDSFRFSADLNAPGGTLVSRIEERGILKGWEQTDAAAPVRHIVTVNQEYIYSNNQVQTLGAEVFSGSLLSRYDIKPGLRASSEFSILAMPMAGLRTTDFLHPLTGRNFDYGPAGGARVEGRLLAKDREVAMVGYTVAWGHTNDGSTNNNVIQYFRAIGRVPIVGRLGAGAGYAWYTHQSTYTNFAPERRSQSEWRAFATWMFY
jgi:uncharacterized protein DUF3943/outer membrane protein with beta-barrel domain